MKDEDKNDDLRRIRIRVSEDEEKAIKELADAEKIPVHVWVTRAIARSIAYDKARNDTTAFCLEQASQEASAEDRQRIFNKIKKTVSSGAKELSSTFYNPNGNTPNHPALREIDTIAAQYRECLAAISQVISGYDSKIVKIKIKPDGDFVLVNPVNNEPVAPVDVWGIPKANAEAAKRAQEEEDERPKTLQEKIRAEERYCRRNLCGED